MFEHNGYMCGGKPTEPIKIDKAKALNDFMMVLCFNNGETRLFDATILKGDVFQPLKDEKTFKAFELDHGVITWCNGSIDCAPEYMYEHSFEYAHIA